MSGDGCFVMAATCYCAGRRRRGSATCIRSASVAVLTCQGLCRPNFNKLQEPVDKAEAEDLRTTIYFLAMVTSNPTRTRTLPHKRPNRNSILRLGILSLFGTTTTTINTVQASADAHRRDDFSFRGPVPEDLRVAHWDFSGSA